MVKTGFFEESRLELGRQAISESLTRTPEAELMDLPDEAKAYAEADFADVNDAYVRRLIELVPTTDSIRLVDLGTGPADIPIRILRSRPDWQITAVDGSQAMLDIARSRLATYPLRSNVELVLADAKQTGLAGGQFDVVCSNSILHHVSDVSGFWAEVKRLVRPGGIVFLRDLFRPPTVERARELANRYAGGESELLREEFYRSLLSAYTPEEIRQQLRDAGLESLPVITVTDRHVDVFGRVNAAPNTAARQALARRPRRLRQHPRLREMVRETHLHPSDFIYPLFVHHGTGIRREVRSLPGVFQFSIDQLGREIAEVAELGIPAVILFGIPEHKDALGTDACSANGIIQQAIRAIKNQNPHLMVISDLCFCEYTDHGHCGPIVERGGRCDVDNDETLRLLGEQAVSHARAGVDMVAPSGMMDGFVASIRADLDSAGFPHLPILAYSAKFASGFYGPFRDAADSAPKLGDRSSYQMDIANGREALREVALDIEQGADIVMVKPALAYLDIIRQVREMSDVPLAAYNVSGEYAMVKAAAANGWIDEPRVTLEILTSIKRAGADMILTYHAKDACRWLRSRSRS